MDIKNEYVTSVKKENNLGFYRIHTIWKNDSFRINIASKDASWSGEMTPENVKELSSRLQIDSQTYIQNCKDALTTTDEKPDMKYSVDDGSFVWKKLVDEDSGISIKLGSVRVEPSNFVETIQKIVDVALTSNKNLQGQISTLNDDKEKLVLRINKLDSAFESLTKSKVEMEQDLYAKFLDVLNSKKKMILDLQNQLGNKKCTKDDVNEVRVLRTAKSTKPAKAPAKAPTRRTRSNKKMSDNEAYEVDTDNDSDGETVQKKKRQSSRLSAKNSNLNVSVSLSNSQKSIVPENDSAANECSIIQKSKNDEHDSDSTISDESLANYAKVSISETNKHEEKIEEGKLTSRKLKAISNTLLETPDDLLEKYFG